MTSVHDLLSRLDKAKAKNGGWMACCPAHDDRDPSLSIKEGDNGRILLYCHAGCKTENVVSALNLHMSDLMPDQQNQEPREVAMYDYTNEAGELLYQVVRYEPKDFRQRRPSGNGEWIYNLKRIPRVPYRLPSIKPAIDSKETIYM